MGKPEGSEQDEGDLLRHDRGRAEAVARDGSAAAVTVRGQAVVPRACTAALAAFSTSVTPSAMVTLPRDSTATRRS